MVYFVEYYNAWCYVCNSKNILLYWDDGLKKKRHHCVIYGVTHCIPMIFGLILHYISDCVPGWLSGKEPTCQCRRCGFDPWDKKIPWCKKWQLTPVFLPGKFHRQMSLEGYNPWGHKELDTTEWLNNNNNVSDYHTKNQIEGIVILG